MNMKNVSKSKRFLGLLFSCSLFCILELVVFLRLEESIRSFFNTTFHIPESILSSFNQDIIAWRGRHRQHRSHNIEILYHVGWHFSLLTLSMRVHSSGRSYIISFSWENYGKNTFSLCQWNQNQIHVLPSSIPL